MQSSGVSLLEQLLLQGPTIMVRDITVTLTVRNHIMGLTGTVAARTIMVVVPTITVVHATITSDPTEIGRSSDRIL